MPPPDFDRLLVPGTRISGACGSGTLVEPLRAELSLPSGEVVASGWSWAPVGFTVTAPPGRYPVLLYPMVFDGGDPDHRMSVAVKLVIRDEPAASWDMALFPRQDPSGLDDRSFCGFAVDGGEASLIDAQYLRELDEGGAFEQFAHDASADLDFGDLLEPFEDEDGRDAVAFRTGDGDGTYPTWIGRTAAGDLACYVLDFLIVGDRG